MDAWRRLLKIGGWLMVTSSIITLVLSLFLYLHARDFTRSAIRTQGTVARLVQRQSREGGIFFHPIVIFRDTRGVQQELFSSAGSFPPAYKVGDTATVLYLENAPDKAKLDSFFGVWGIAALVAGLGCLQLVLGLALLLMLSLLDKLSAQPPIIKTA